jgi:hypothetical protein
MEAQTDGMEVEGFRQPTVSLLQEVQHDAHRMSWVTFFAGVWSNNTQSS